MQGKDVSFYSMMEAAGLGRGRGGGGGGHSGTADADVGAAAASTDVAVQNPRGDSVSSEYNRTSTELATEADVDETPVMTTSPETTTYPNTTITTPFNMMSGNDDVGHHRQRHEQQQRRQHEQGRRSDLVRVMQRNLDIKDPRRWDSRRRLLDDDGDVVPSLHPSRQSLSYHPTMITNNSRGGRASSSSSSSSLVVTSDGIHNVHTSSTSHHRPPQMMSHDDGEFFTLSQRHFPTFMSTIVSEQGEEVEDDLRHRKSTNKRDNGSSSSTYDTSFSGRRSSIVDRSSFEDQSHAVESFFASIRVPASFIVATSFSEMFGMYNGDDGNGDIDDYKNDTMVQQYLQGLCIGCQFVSFMLSLTVVVFSTAALIRGLTANFDPYAENGYELLFREFHYEFIVTRWSFQISLFGFLAAVCSKILYEFQLFNVASPNFDRQHLEIGIAIIMVMSSLCLHLFSYINSTLIGWKNSK